MTPKLQIKIFAVIQIIINYSKIGEKGTRKERREGKDRVRGKKARKEGRRENVS